MGASRRVGRRAPQQQRLEVGGHLQAPRGRLLDPVHREVPQGRHGEHDAGQAQGDPGQIRGSQVTLPKYRNGNAL